jgi:hypothetical protein
VELKRRAQAEKGERIEQMPVGEHPWLDESEEDEVFAVLCVYSQLLCIGALWCCQRF